MSDQYVSKLVKTAVDITSAKKNRVVSANIKPRQNTYLIKERMFTTLREREGHLQT